MYSCDVWIWVDDKSRKETAKTYAYSLETVLQHGACIRKRDCKQIVGTWNRATLLAIAEALERFKTNAEVTIHSENQWILNMMERYLLVWEGSDFWKSKNEKVANEEEWRRIAKMNHSLKLLYDRIGFDRSEELKHHVISEE